MPKKEMYKKVVRDVFFFMLAVSNIFYAYSYYTSMNFNFQLFLIIITALFGILYFYFMFLKKIKIPRVRITSIMKKPAIILILFVDYSIFLNWIFQKMPFDAFIFFLLLFYIPIFYTFGINPKSLVIIALILLVGCAITLTQGREDYANKIAIYSYYFLAIGIILLSVDNLLHLRR